MMTEGAADPIINSYIMASDVHNVCVMRHRRRPEESYVYDWCYPGVLVLLVFIFAGGLSSLHQRDTIKAYATGVFLILFVFLLGASVCAWYYSEHSSSMGVEEASRAQAPRVARQAEVCALTAGCDARRSGA